MILRQVIIANFFCYLDKNVFDFTEGLNIISAKNGGGKSQFFNAIYWVFFDRIYSDENSNKKKWQIAQNVRIYPDKFAHDLPIGDEFTTSVEITLDALDYQSHSSSTDDKVRYTFTKDITFKKKGQIIVNNLPADLRIEYTKDGETHIVNRAQHEMLLDFIFPRSIRKFMWYQGETMDLIYDFSNDSTLKHAINEISYFPKYDFMDKVVKASEVSINKKIEKELNRQNKLTKEENVIYADIAAIERTIEGLESRVLLYTNDIQYYEDEITKVEQKLEGLDHFMEYKMKLTKLEADLTVVKSEIENIDNNTKERLINKWMLNGCDKLIKASESKLNVLNSEIQEINKTQNPVPTTLPGPEYVERMLEDKVCYICERTVEEDSEPYFALKRRMNDFEKSAQNKMLQDNYTELNRYKRQLLKDLPSINSEIVENNKKIDSLISKRNSLKKQINNIFTELGSDQRADLEQGANIAQNNTQKLKSHRADLATKHRYLNGVNSDLSSQRTLLNEKKAIRDTFVKKSDTSLIESVAANYIKMFVAGINKLKTIAYTNLINELEAESNRLYSLYLGGKQQGKIIFKDGVRIVDVATEQPLVDLNTGEIVAEKLSVANSFLSLSAKKMNRSYPLIADAPSSDLDSDNTFNLTINIGKSFDQIIIMSKDYSQFTDSQLNDLIEKADIKNFYSIENILIDQNGPNSRTNKRSVTTKVK
ncbi:AAA family ATPase [Rufibacter sp. XAAS-G3-1]|uniref:AAA family ATPase n=1 Tax=Rufibacter sp. XAAS-G3-1 TaxID=2729134 RepID=UPI0015E724B1|nr:AAA family ATPase [Rufibacter sp. XAAS-G3-1]